MYRRFWVKVPAIKVDLKDLVVWRFLEHSMDGTLKLRDHCTPSSGTLGITTSKSPVREGQVREIVGGDIFHDNLNDNTFKTWNDIALSSFCFKRSRNVMCSQIFELDVPFFFLRVQNLI
jgi:hypothetical protein